MLFVLYRAIFLRKQLKKTCKYACASVAHVHARYHVVTIIIIHKEIYSVKELELNERIDIIIVLIEILLANGNTVFMALHGIHY